jgi:hypothetical protein
MEKTNKRFQFKFYRSYYDIMLELPEADRLKYLEAILHRQFTGKEIELSGMAKFAYISQKHSIDKQVEGWEAKNGGPLDEPMQDPMQGGSVGGSVGPSIQTQTQTQTEPQRERKREQALKLDFDLFWLPYPKKEAKKAAQKVWDKLSIEKQQKAIDALPSHITKWAEKDNLYVPNASKWFNEERWEDVLDVSQTNAGPRLKPEFRHIKNWEDKTYGETENLFYYTIFDVTQNAWRYIKASQQEKIRVSGIHGAEKLISCHE